MTTKDPNGKQKGQTKKPCQKGKRNNADARRGLGAATNKSPKAGDFSNSINHPVCQGRRADREFGRKAGGILRQKLLNTRTQLAFYKEQIRRLKQEEHQLSVLCEEFAKSEVTQDDIQSFSDGELE